MDDWFTNNTVQALTIVEREIEELQTKIEQLVIENGALNYRMEQFKQEFAGSMRDLFVKHMEDGDMDITDEELMEVISRY